MTLPRTLLVALACLGLTAFAACHENNDDQPPGGFHPTVTTNKPKPTPPTQLPPDGDQQVANSTPPPTPKPSVENAQPTNPAPTPAVKRDYPYGVPVEGKPGYVTSPYAPDQGYVDVHGFTPGQEVRDPFTGKIFLVP